ncbi:SRPBCC family protein [uncultured Bdellovibrio sp.]|uniref:SRPBCC family protein n=1 Tax=Bdellovibrio sp. HCB-162 TaxID=3394234 RepID=UPI0025D425D2|nr:SRPBCC family protein [uncultured Bdellovibrio sp.]
MENQETVVTPEEQQQRLLDQGLYTAEAVTVLSSPEELYNFWLDPTNFMTFTEQLEAVHQISETKSHWVWRALKGGKTVEWVSEIVEQKPYSLIAWRSTPESDLRLSGRVEFVPLNYHRGTVVRVKMAYDLPTGNLLNLIEKTLGESPHRNLKINLIKLRELFEAGEIPKVEGQPAGNKREHETKTALH